MAPSTNRTPSIHTLQPRRIVTAFLLVFVLLCAFACNPDPPPPYALGPDGPRYHNRTFVVVNIIDGDTIDIDIPDGDSPFTRIRLLGIDTPETKHPRMSVQYFGPEATAYVERLLSDRSVIVTLDPASDIRGSYGRLLAYLELPDGRILNELLLLNGFAYADPRFPYSRKDRYQLLQYTAQAAAVGLWKHVTFDRLPPWLQRLNPNILIPMNVH